MYAVSNMSRNVAGFSKTRRTRVRSYIYIYGAARLKLVESWAYIEYVKDENNCHQLNRIGRVRSKSFRDLLQYSISLLFNHLLVRVENVTSTSREKRDLLYRTYTICMYKIIYYYYYHHRQIKFRLTGICRRRKSPSSGDHSVLSKQSYRPRAVDFRGKRYYMRIKYNKL
ncbi:unnamed protein product [Aphis gossypii]|uniref:Uncharacterized protein n=1 Tax=Aphis gossypii TaxID=80765 RepID=A0A9P0IQK2_APHGO|nr:unnamed protein product [Aphis gossypii]